MNALSTVRPEPPVDVVKLLPAPNVSREPTQSSFEDEQSVLFTVEEIQIRAETVTPLLKEILNFRPPPHWGINE